MFRQGIINPAINYYLSTLGHQDTIMVSDAAMELPADATRVDLAFTPGLPEITSVVKGLLAECIVEKVYMAEEMKTHSSSLYTAYEQLFSTQGIPIECVPHTRFCELAGEVTTTIRTGEFHYHYSSVILVSGCPY